MHKYQFSDRLVAVDGTEYVVTSTDSSRVWLYNKNRDLVVARVSQEGKFSTEYVKNSQGEVIFTTESGEDGERSLIQNPCYVISHEWTNEVQKFALAVFETTQHGQLVRYISACPVTNSERVKPVLFSEIMAQVRENPDGVLKYVNFEVNANFRVEDSKVEMSLGQPYSKMDVDEALSEKNQTVFSIDAGDGEFKPSEEEIKKIVEDAYTKEGEQDAEPAAFFPEYGDSNRPGKLDGGSQPASTDNNGDSGGVEQNSNVGKTESYSGGVSPAEAGRPEVQKTSEHESTRMGDIEVAEGKGSPETEKNVENKSGVIEVSGSDLRAGPGPFRISEKKLDF